MSVEVDNQVTDITHLDFQFVPECEAELDDDTRCDNKADFICALKCCGRIVLLCEECLFEWIEYVKYHPHVSFFCFVCEFKHEPGIDPLKVLRRL